MLKAVGKWNILTVLTAGRRSCILKHLDSLTTHQRRRLYELCWQFEESWNSGHCPPLQDWLAQVGDLPADIVLAELSETQRELEQKTAAGVAKIPLAQDERYEFVGEIARGGAAVVWRVRDRHLQRETAVKFLLDSNDNHSMRARLEREARLCARLVHPGIVPIHELSAFSDKRPFVSMKLVEGKTLRELLQADPPPALSSLIDIFTKACQAMAYAHQKDVIHRDLKPGNIMVGSFGEVQIMDWGLAKDLSQSVVGHNRDAESSKTDCDCAIETAIEENTVGDGVATTENEVTRFGTVFGTIPYMAPEQARGEVDATNTRSDVFALGAVLCRMITGAPPYQDNDQHDLLRKAQQADLSEALQRLSSSRHHRLARLAAQCMSPDPSLRPADASAVVTELATIQRIEQRQSRAVRYVGVVSCLAVILALCIWFMNKRTVETMPSAQLARVIDLESYKSLLRSKPNDLTLNSHSLMLEKHGSDRELLYLVGVALVNASRFAEAERVVRQLVTLDTREPEYPFLLSETLYWQGKFAESSEALQESKKRRDAGVSTHVPIDDKLARAQMSADLAKNIETLKVADFGSLDSAKLIDAARACRMLQKIELAIAFNHLALSKDEDVYHRSLLRHQMLASFAQPSLSRDDLPVPSRDALCRACVVWLRDQFELAQKALETPGQHQPIEQLMVTLVESKELRFLGPLVDDARIAPDVRSELGALLDAIQAVKLKSPTL